MKLSEAKKLSGQVIRAEIDGCGLSHDGKKEFTLYHVRCTTRDGRAWVTRKRYSEFVELQKQMQLAGCDGIIAIKLPKKRLMGNSDKTVQERLLGLQGFLAKVVGMYADHGILIEFFRPEVMTGGHPGWRTQESKQRLEQLHMLVQQLARTVGPDHPNYRAMHGKLKHEMQLHSQAHSWPAPTLEAGESPPEGIPPPGSRVTPTRLSLTPADMVAEMERDEELRLRHGALEFDRAAALQKDLASTRVQRHIEELESHSGKINTEEFQKLYTLGGLLGEGGFGRVYRCTHKKTGLVFAVKMIPNNQKGFKVQDLLEETRLQRICCEGSDAIVKVPPLPISPTSTFAIQRHR
eukprot:COSAG05_NODE_651_length_8095_cov_17.048572_3_plen_350_part_00